MPEETDIIISELTNAPQIDDTAVFPLTQDNGGSPATFKASMSEIAGKIAEETTFVNLETTAKNLVGAINELADGGASADITTEITTPAPIMSFADGGDGTPLKSCNVAVVAQQAGSGTPSPSNVRAITGFDAIDVSVAGKNLFDITALNKGNVTVSNGIASGTAEAFHNAFSSGTIMYLPKAQIVFSFYAYTDQSASSTGNGLRSRIVYTDGTSDDVYCPNSTTSYTRFTIISNAEKTPSRLTFTYSTANNNTWYVKDVQLELSDEATSFEAYTGTTTTIPLGQTIYGGSLECVEGSGTVTKAFYDLANYTGTVTKVTSGGVASRTYFRFDDLSPYPLILSLGGSIISDKYEQATITASTTDVGISIGSPSALSHSTVCFRPENPNSYTESTIMDFIRNILGSLQICYDVATPTSLSVSGANIPTLSGVNNVYADCGDINSLEYFNSKADDIANMVKLMTRT